MNKLATLTLLLVMPNLHGQVDFSREVLPILADQCYLCHGPDDGNRKAELRFDKKESAFRTQDGVTPIKPGKSGESDVIRRIFSNGDDQMPPANSQRSLTAKQKETLKKWVDEGAKWGRHWAYEPLPKSVAVPKVKDAAWAKQPLDAFILARLEREGLKPAKEAPKEAWLRRVNFDLTGLPPTPVELDAFLKDDSPQAYEKVVDRLLASPRYGERMASDWLDLARYADTYGYQHDRARPMWPYRDWVIQAFNENKKYNQFAIEQLAGDLIPKATKQQKLATAFNRLHMQNEEGGVVEEEFRVAYVVDRVNTFGTAFLGQTFECARCHDHKYDPISQKDYYSLFAFFQNIDESGQTSYFTNAMNTPTLLLSTPEQDVRIAELSSAVKDAEAVLAKIHTDGKDDFTEWKREWNGKLELPDLVASFAFDSLDKSTTPNSVNEKLPGKAHEQPKLVEGKSGKAVQLDGENGFEFPGVGHFTKSDSFTISLWIKPDVRPKRAVILHHSKASIDAGSRGYELILQGKSIAFGMHHMWPGNSLVRTSFGGVEVGEWNHVCITYQGHADGLEVSVNAHFRRFNDVVRTNLTRDINYDNGEPNLTLGYRFRDNGFKNGCVDDLRIYNRALTWIEVESIAGRFKKASDRELESYYFSAIHKASRKQLATLTEARKKLAAFINPIPEIMVMEEVKHPKSAYILKRGGYDSHGEEVIASTPDSILAFPEAQPRNRLGLAKWFTQPDHPLAARVQANRLWQQMFGRGIVETSENFGTTGTPPSHGDLLDWLARDFVEHDWDVKRALKQFSLSATYRQSSRTTAEVRAKDPLNELLARAPVRRLTAEMLRDQALFSSGLLVEKLGGSSVFPYQPAGLWDDAMGKPAYPQSKGDGLYRRSLYTNWKRTAPPPALTAFDAANREVCTARRQTTSTPLQALILLNDPQYVEAAKFFAERMMNQKDDNLRWGFRTMLGRVPSDAEIKVLTALFEEQKAHFEKNPKAAEKLLSVGDKKRSEKLNAVEHAAYTQVALTLFNHDEAVNRR